MIWQEDIEMIIDLHRLWRKPGYTIGKLYIDGVFVCNTLEDRDRGLTSDMSEQAILARKVKAQTAIPIGSYPVSITYSPRFKKYLPLISNVKGFSGIRIHSGNTAEDTEGCILVGKNTEVGKVTNSRAWYSVVLEYIKEGLEHGKVTINIHW